jgi:hypothetical protein
MITVLGGWLENQKIMSTWFLNDTLFWGLYRKYPKKEGNQVEEKAFPTTYL